MENIESRILFLVDSIIEGLEKIGYQTISCKQPLKRSGIIYFTTTEPDKLMKHLQDNNVIVALRNGKIRISPHFYCNEEDIEKFLYIMNKFG